MSEKVIYAAILGAGTVGMGTYKLCQAMEDEIKHKTGARLVIKKILVRNIGKKRDGIPEELLTDDWTDIITDDQISIIVELMGGIHPAKDYVLDALKAGIVNLEKHIENLHKFGVPVVVTLNSFVTDTKAETDFVEQFCKERGCEFALSEVWEKGGEGGIDLANKVLETIEHKESNFKVLYDDSLSLKEKIETVAKEIYGADGVTYSPAAERELKRITDLGMGDFPVCMAKTQYSLSDDAKKLGRPSGFKINVREVYASAGAGFVVAVNGSIMTMPGLSKKPAAYGIDVDDNGVITGLF